MNLGVLLIVLGVVVAVLAHHTLGVLMVLIGLVLVLIPPLRRVP